MKISPAGLDLIRAFEGLRLTAYPDPGTGGAPWTIGYGHTGDDVYPGQTITRERADALLAADVARFERAVTRLVTVPLLTQDQFDALVSLTYNIGEGALAGSTLLARLNAGDYRGAGDELLRWNRAGGQIMPGLRRRRERERELFLRGIPAAQPAPAERLEPATGEIYPPADTNPPTATENAPERVLEAPMTPILTAILPSLISAVPELSKIFGSGSAVSQRNAAAAGVLLDLAKSATGAVNEQQAVERVVADPAPFAAAVRENWFALVEAGGGGIGGARDADARRVESGVPMYKSGAFVITLLLLPLIYGVVAAVVFQLGGEWSAEIRASAVSAVISGVLFAVVGYWLGSSQGSASKDAMLRR